ncbi:cadmium resistance transporter [Phormidium tenue FACHB-886]|nr:cadmium resistance transporter [Phormidium tenue FACHB-886]
MLFFGQVGANLQTRQIVVGQYLGFALLILLSLPGFLGGLLIDEAWIGLLGLMPIAIGILKLIKPEDEEEEIQTVSEQFLQSHKWFRFLKLSPQTYSVVAVTVANGGDNIGIYVPLFAGSSAAELGVILAVYFVLIGVWCYVAQRLAQQPGIARLLSRYGDRLVPWVLIGLGLYILIENGSYRLVTTALN